MARARGKEVRPVGWGREATGLAGPFGTPLTPKGLRQTPPLSGPQFPYLHQRETEPGDLKYFSFDRGQCAPPAGHSWKCPRSRSLPRVPALQSYPRVLGKKGLLLLLVQPPCLASWPPDFLPRPLAPRGARPEQGSQDQATCGRTGLGAFLEGVVLTLTWTWSWPAVREMSGPRGHATCEGLGVGGLDKSSGSGTLAWEGWGAVCPGSAGSMLGASQAG